MLSIVFIKIDYEQKKSRAPALTAKARLSLILDQ